MSKLIWAGLVGLALLFSSVPSHAQFILNELAGFGAGADSNSVTRTFGARYVDTSNLTSYSIGSVSFGTAATSRIVACTFQSIANGDAAARTADTATIGGISATIVQTNVQADLGGGTFRYVVSGVIYAVVPTGTSGTVAMTFNAGMASLQIGSVAVYGAASVATDTDSNTGTTISSLSLTALTVPSDGVAIASMASHDDTDATFSWSAALTEDYDNTSETGSLTGSGASAEFASGSTPTITVTPSDTLRAGALVGVAFGPG